MRITFGIKIILALFATIAIVSAAIYLTTSIFVSKGFEHMAMERLSGTRRATEAQLEDMRNNIAKQINLVAEDQNMKVLVMSEDLKQLKKYSDKILDMGGYDFVAFTDAKGKVLGASQAETVESGLGDASEIAAAMQEGSFAGVFDDENLGLVMAGARGIEFGMQHIGTVIAGYAFSSHHFVDALNRNLGVHASVFAGSKRISSTIKNGEERIVGSALKNSAITEAVLKKGKIHSAKTTVNGEPFFASYWPLVTYDGKIAGILAIARDTSAMSSILESVNRGVVLAGLAVAALMGVLGALFARSISRPVRLLSEYAREVAGGRIDKRIELRRNDELGDLAVEMSSIPETFAALTREFRNTSSDIRAGKLGSRADSSGFEGAYAQIINDVNDLADMYTNFFDEMPTPVMTVDKRQTILFMNKAGAELNSSSSEKLTGAKCFDHFRTSDCRGDCAVKRCIRTLEKTTGETDAHPGGSSMEIKYIAVPIVDENGLAVGAFEIVFDQTEIVGAHRNIRETAGKAQEIATRLAGAANELSSQIASAAQGSDLQRASVSETATAMEEMSSSVLEVARNATSAAEHGDEAKARAREGEQIVSQVVESIERMHSLSSNLADNMSDLDRKAQNIGRIMNVINDIADQTNLLALNAAIEAARAGEAGRGFAVVADEVRKLAEKTMEATNEVGQAIGTIQNGTGKTIKEAEESNKVVAEGAELARKSGDKLRDIVGLAEITADQVRNIAAAAKQQSTSSEEINRATSEIDRVSARNSDSMTRSSESVNDLAALARQLQNLIDGMNGNRTGSAS